jgi:hypothetical protein
MCSFILITLKNIKPKTKFDCPTLAWIVSFPFFSKGFVIESSIETIVRLKATDALILLASNVSLWSSFLLIFTSNNGVLI